MKPRAFTLIEGYAVVRVDGERVRADIHVGQNRPAWHTLDLTALRNGSK